MPELKESLVAPSSKDEATAYARDARKNFEEWKSYNLANDVPVKITDGEVYRWIEPEPPQRSAIDPNGKMFKSDEEWQIYLERQKEAGKWVIDTAGQGLYDFWQNSAADAKEFSSSKGTARSYLATEADKTAEITRQFKDFDARANLLYDLMDEEQQYGMRADDQNIQNFKAQQDLGMAVVPGGVYGKPSMANSLSSILRPSLPDYVRPDYRLNAAVGLPGAQGFDDPDYNQYGFPAFANGTEAEGYIKVPPVPVVSWPWRKE